MSSENAAAKATATSANLANQSLKLNSAFTVQSPTFQFTTQPVKNSLSLVTDQLRAAIIVVQLSGKSYKKLAQLLTPTLTSNLASLANLWLSPRMFADVNAPLACQLKNQLVQNATNLKL